MHHRLLPLHACFSIMLAGVLVSATASGAGCEPKAARLVSLQGALDVQEGKPEWEAVTPEREFCPGDRVRTHAQSRATLELNDKTYVSLSQQTTVVLSGLRPRGPSWLDLLKGIIYVRSRTPSSLDVRTRYINAAIKGTEFLVSADDAQAEVTVLEGTVESSNSLGSVTLTDGQAAVAKAGEAPIRKILLSPRDAVQWALYYPPLIDLQSLERQSSDPAVKRAVARYAQGDSLGALAALDTAEHPDLIARAGLLLGLGRVREAQPLLDGIAETDPRFADALALRAVIALARDDKAQAMALAQRATALQKLSPIVWTALAYARQAEFNLDGALQAASEATRLAPGNGLAHAREAELLAALGRHAEAKAAASAAAQINPRLARAWAVRGYAELNEMDADEAAVSFRKAIDLDNADPLARFGLGLAKIRVGELEAGTADLEIAANLDPSDALTRSYLGKAYYEQKNSKVSATEYATAKQFDPNDPTPWFYDAIKKQTENRPGEALVDMQKAIELNDNRAVYRSKQLLDSDLAARSASLARIYRNLNFEKRALVEGWNSVEADPTDFSGHRLLADSYSALPRHEIARTSELLVSQLLQPLSMTPVQPHLAESNLAILNGSGPQSLSFNEFNPLFTRDHFSLQTSGLVGSNNTFSDEVTHSAVQGPISYSLGQLHYETSGFRPNNDLRQNIYNAYFQASVTPDFNVLLEARHRDIDYGDLNFVFDLKAYNPNLRRNLSLDTLRLGTHYKFSERSHFITTLTYMSTRENALVSSDLNVNQDGKAYNGETQFLYHGDLSDWIIGQGYVSQDGNIGFSSISSTQTFSRHANGYVYSHIRFPDTVSWTLGFSVDSLEDHAIGTVNRVNPKFGMRWQITPDTLLRMAAFTAMRRPLPGNQTIEPTQIAGFNQFYDDSGGTTSAHYGIGLDQKFSRQLYAGIEGSYRDMSIPIPVYSLTGEVAGASRQSSSETVARAYLHWMPMPEVAVSSEYQYEDYSGTAYQTQTHLFPTSVHYFHDSGLFASGRVTYVDQHYVPLSAAAGSQNGKDRFALVDIGFGYRLPKRYGILRFEARNIFDQDFNYFSAESRDTTLVLGGGSPLFLPTRTFYGYITLSF